MKMRISQKSKKKNRFFNKLGMTYVELLCALSLLTLIVVMFTPMLLSSYENLYKAGETVEQVYDSKEELEEGLATRYSVKTVVFSKFNLGFNNLQTNADLLFEAINVNGKKVVSSFQKGLETVFGNARASVDIISPKIVYDDKSNHDVIIQTSGIEYSKVIFGSYTAKYGTNQDTADAAFLNAHKTNIANGGKGVIFIEVMVPDKSINVSSSGTTTEEAVYNSSNIANLKLYKVENLDEPVGSATTSGEFSMLNTDNYGRIKFNISGRTGTPLDFTQSPIKINIYYINPREQVKECSDYLVIDPPTMIFAGDANGNVDYYTSAGVTEKDGTYSFEVEARKMRIANSGLFTSSDTPGSRGVRIQSVTWVQNDENPKLKPYYVMAGTHSGVYRMYNYRVNTTIDGVFGITGTTDTPEGSLVLSDGSGVNPSFWSGEMSDQYYFKTMEHASGYGAGEYVGADCTAYRWQEDKNGTKKYTRHHHGSRYDYFDKTLRYSMSFNGFSTGYDYQHLANRRISYILTEVGAGRSFRFGGRLRDGEFSDYSMPWEPSETYYQGSGYRSRWSGLNYRIFETEDKGSPFEGPVYYQKYSGIFGSENVHYDRHFAYIRLKSYISVDPIAATKANNDDFVHRFNKGDFWWPYGYNEDRDSKKAITDQYANDWDWLSQNTANNVNVVSSVFLPGSGSKGQGQVIYFGTVPAYAFIEQSSDIGTNDEPHAQHVYNGENAISSRQTGYVVTGTQGNGTTIHRYFNIAEQNIDSVSDYFVAYWQGKGGNLSVENNKNTFYTYGQSDKALYYTDDDLEFTFGYCSRWRMAIGDVTYNGVNEVPRSYEKYYTASNPSASYKLTRGQVNTQGENNLYYNVWFPGEYYNLTHVATLDEITVAVGYAVSGSSFMKESAAWGEYGKSGGYYGTALGSIYNDAVMAAYVSEDAGGKVFTEGLAGKGERNVIFQNLLYYKMPTFLDNTLHSRDSVRFTAVDLFAHTTEPTQSGTALTSSKEYFAVYGDSNGRAYFSVIASSTITGSVEAGTAKEAGVVLRTAGTTSGALKSSDMHEITLNNGASLSTIYSEITNIDASENIVIISGTAKDKNTVEQLIIATKDDEKNNVWSFKRVYNGTFKGVINNAMILGDYYYIAGDGWVAAVSLDTLRKLPDGGTITNKTESLGASAEVTGSSTNKDHLLWVGTQTNIHAIGGRLTEG